MQKLSSQKIAQVLEDTRTVLLSVTAERDKLASQVSTMETRFEAEKLAFTMHDKGLELDTPIEDLVAGLEKRGAAGDLDTIREAVNMVAPNMGLTSTVSDEPRGGGDGSSLMNYVLGGVG